MDSSSTQNPIAKPALQTEIFGDSMRIEGAGIVGYEFHARGVKATCGSCGRTLVICFNLNDGRAFWAPILKHDDDFPSCNLLGGE